MSSPRLHTSNTEQPFEPGEIVQYAGRDYVVEANHGDYGTVGDFHDGALLEQFYWAQHGHMTRRVGGTVKFTRPKSHSPLRAAA